MTSGTSTVLVLCQGAKAQPSDPSESDALQLAHGPSPSANLTFEVGDFYRYASGGKYPFAIDLVRIATYVYAADTSVSRGSDTDVWGDQWHRDFFFRIPVIDVAHWNAASVKGALTECLSFLTGDSFTFEFEDWTQPDHQQFLALFEGQDLGLGIDSICLFSGGVDSLCAAVQLAERDSRHPLLITHRSAQRLIRSRRELRDALVSHSTWHYPSWEVEIKRRGSEGPERSQRSRAFLYASLGAAAAFSLRAPDIFLSDNGVTSLNIVHAALAAGSQRTRSTHPHFLELFQRLLQQLDPSPPRVANTLLAHTKPEVVQQLASLGIKSLLPLTVSCVRFRAQTNAQPHCGTCSQCIDRRIAAEHAGVTTHDPVASYGVDIFTQDLPAGGEAALIEGLFRWAGDVQGMTPDRFVEEYPDVWSATVPGRPESDQVIEFHELYQRYASQILTVLGNQMTKHVQQIAAGSLPPRCALRLIPATRQSRVQRAASAIASIVADGLPIAFRTVQAKNERQVQDQVDALLRANEDRIKREHPTIRFATKRYTPDFSPHIEPLSVEVKFIRATRRPAAIVDEISADIAAHRKGNRSVLNIVYDPNRLISDDQEFTEDLEEHNGVHVFVRIVR